jgi:hypothetical protein
VCQGNIFSQYAIDCQDGDGSLCYPYYPSKEHFCKPAQGDADFVEDVAAAGADGFIFEPCNDFGVMVDKFGSSKCLVGSFVDCRDLTLGKRDRGDCGH